MSKEELIKKLEEKIDWIKTTYCPKYNYSTISYHYYSVFVDKLDSQHYLHGKYDSGESYPCYQPDSEDQSPFDSGEGYVPCSFFYKKINNYSSIGKRQFGLGKDEKMWELDELIADVTPLILFPWWKEANKGIWYLEGGLFAKNVCDGELFSFGPDPLVNSTSTNETEKGFADVFYEDFVEAMGDVTVQQRVKTLLILKAINDYNLSERFGIGKLSKITFKESKKNDMEKEDISNGDYVIGLDFFNRDYEMVTDQGSVSRPVRSTSHFWHEALYRICRHVINPSQKGPIVQPSDSSVDSLNPQFRTEAEEEFLKTFIKRKVDYLSSDSDD